MVLAAGGFRAARVRGARPLGFTLLEILLALALIGLLSASLITAGTHLIDSRPRTPEEVFWEATRTARRTALKTQTEVGLSFDEKEKRFVVTQGETGSSFSRSKARGSSRSICCRRGRPAAPY